MVFPESLRLLARSCEKPLYVVGGSVRDFLCGYPLPANADWDISSPMTEDELLSAAEKNGFTVKSVFRHTGTVKLQDPSGAVYEFTRFRSDKYVRGEHKPSRTEFTDDIGRDARRRDFCANAVYYDIGAQTFVDPLGGISDIRKKILRTVAPAEKVFGEDGLRLMRLARIAAQTGFSPDEEALCGARENAPLIRDIVPERIFAELGMILYADEKHALRDAPYRGMKLLHEIGVLKEILPELALGEGMLQNPLYHDHDVLEHSLRALRDSAPEVRYAALLHDVGKPLCYLRDGNYHAHPEEGALLAEKILTRLKAPKALTEETVSLVRLHMRDYNLLMRESKVRREIVENYALLDKLFLVKQADFSACKDDPSVAPVIGKWKRILSEMRREGVPCTLKDLKVNGEDLKALGVAPHLIGDALKTLLFFCTDDGKRNEKEYLLHYYKRNFMEE